MPTNDISDAGASAVHVRLDDARTPESIDPVEAIPDLIRTVKTVLAGEGVGAGSVDLHLVDPDVIAELNEEHLGGSGPTDVLSFPLDAPGLAEATTTSPGPCGTGPHIGDIVICVDVARLQASGHCGSLPAELELLAIHGVLHLLGHDHAEPDEKAVMQGLEADYLARAGYTHPGDHE